MAVREAIRMGAKVKTMHFSASEKEEKEIKELCKQGRGKKRLSVSAVVRARMFDKDGKVRVV